VSALPSTFSVGGVQLSVTLPALAVGGLLPLDPEPEELEEPEEPAVVPLLVVVLLVVVLVVVDALCDAVAP